MIIFFNFHIKLKNNNNTTRNFIIPMENDIERIVIDGNIEALKLYNGNLHFRNRAAESLLHTAAYYGHLDICVYLHQRGCSFYDYDNEDAYPIHHAAMNDNSKIVEWMVETDNALLNIVIWTCNYTPLHMAAKNYGINTMICLILHGADVMTRDTNNWMPLDHFLNNNPEYLAKYFADYDWNNDNRNVLITILTMIKNNEDY